MSESSILVWFIAGCSTGFGREIVRAVLYRGWRTVVTARNPDQVQDLVAGCKDRALALELDVTDAAQVFQAVKAAETRFGHIDVLVNNAGYAYSAAVEEGGEAEIRAIFETNVFALIAITQAVLPGMRARRSGCIVQMSSIGGVTSFPGTGYYYVTKFVVEGRSDSLAQEVAPLGIKVINVEPGPFRTRWVGSTLRKSSNRIADYDQTSGARRAETEARDGQQMGDPVRAAQASLDAVQSPSPPLHFLLGKPAQDIARARLASLKTDYNAWEAVGLACDFLDGGLGLWPARGAGLRAALAEQAA